MAVGDYKPDSDKIRKLYHNIEPEKVKREKAIYQKMEFLKIFSNEETKFLFLGLIAILALFFDYWVSVQTMRPLKTATKLRPELLAFIFNLLDIFIAILASGILAKSIYERDKFKKIYLPILWSLCGLKIILFMAFSFVVVKGTINPIGTIIIVALAILVYVILHLGGGGLYYLLGKLKYLFLLEIYIEDPIKMKLKLKNLFHELEIKCQKYGDDFVAVKAFFKLDKININ